MKQNTATVSHSENRWVPLKSFCERTGIKIRTARYYIHTGKLKIKPKTKPNERVFVDWFAWNNG